MKYSKAVSRIKNPKLNAEKRRIYFPAFPGSRFVYSRNVIKLASEEISVPTPPIFTPTSNARQSLVNCGKSIAEGTLLMN